MFNKQGDCLIIDGREDRRLTIVVSCIHVSTQLQQLLLNVSEKSFVQGCVSVFVMCIHVGASLSQ